MPQPSIACTTFSFIDAQQVFVGKSYDWDKEFGAIHINKRHVKKSSLRVYPTDVSFEWESRFGSVTFNQYGREIPNAGVNEMGLIVEVMVLNSKFPAPSAKPSVNESQWVQYMLDSASTVQDMIALSSKIRLSKILVPLHYLACDRTGACAAFEYINGDLTITNVSEKGNKALTNNTYESSMAQLRLHDGFGGNRPIPQGSGSIERFIKISDHLAKLRFPAPRDSVDFAFEGLNIVKASDSKWQIVYDIEAKQIHFRSKTAPAVKRFDTDAFDYSCGKPVKVFDIQSIEGGDVTERFEDYSEASNNALVKRSLGSSLPAPLVKLVMGLPASTTCVTP
jgi:choloylglycine hydrolase